MIVYLCVCVTIYEIDLGLREQLKSGKAHGSVIRVYYTLAVLFHLVPATAMSRALAKDSCPPFPTQQM